MSAVPILLDRVLVFPHPRLPNERPLPGFVVACHPDGMIDAVVFADRARLQESQPIMRVLGPVPVLRPGVQRLPGWRGPWCAYLQDEALLFNNQPIRFQRDLSAPPDEGEDGKITVLAAPPEPKDEHADGTRMTSQPAGKSKPTTSAKR